LLFEEKNGKEIALCLEKWRKNRSSSKKKRSKSRFGDKNGQEMAKKSLMAEKKGE
jgi:hypothetical protein